MHDAFKGLNIESDPSFEEYINKYNVLKNRLRRCLFKKSRKIEYCRKKINSLVVTEFRKQFLDLFFPEWCDIATAIQIVYESTREQFVIILNEYDTIIREKKDDELNPYLTFLNGLFKGSSISSAIALAYITGILPIVRDVVQSKLNNFTEYTMIEAYSLSPFIGFTKDEVRALSERNGMDMAEMERWYDGYCVDGVELYSPKSVIEALKKRNAAAIGL